MAVPAGAGSFPPATSPRQVTGNRILLGAFLELVLIIANIGTAVCRVSLLKRVSEVCAVGFVTARLVECTSPDWGS